MESSLTTGEGRKVKKVRVKYRERVRLKERPRGYRIKRFVRKNKGASSVIVMTVMAVIATYLAGVEETLDALANLWVGFTNLLYGRD